MLNLPSRSLDLVDALGVDDDRTIRGALEDILEFCANHDLVIEIRMADVHFFRKVLVGRDNRNDEFGMGFFEIFGRHAEKLAPLFYRMDNGPA